MAGVRISNMGDFSDFLGVRRLQPNTLYLSHNNNTQMKCYQTYQVKGDSNPQYSEGQQSSLSSEDHSNSSHFQKDFGQSFLHSGEVLNSKTVQRYMLDYQIISRKIKGKHRIKLLKWVQAEASRRKYPRKILALTSYYFDLYVMRSEMIELEDLHEIALSALLLAIKMEGGKFPSLGSIFDKNKILQYEMDICLALNYFLDPPTYAFLIDFYAYKWDTFIHQKAQRNSQSLYLAEAPQAHQHLLTLYERAEYLNMIIESLKFSFSSLIFNLFYLHTKIHWEKVDLTLMNSQDIYNFVEEAYAKDDEFNEVFERFTIECSPSINFGDLDVQVGLYISWFLSIKTEGRSSMGRCRNFEDCKQVQTFSSSGLKQLERLQTSDI